MEHIKDVGSSESESEPESEPEPPLSPPAGGGTASTTSSRLYGAASSCVPMTATSSADTVSSRRESAASAASVAASRPRGQTDRPVAASSRASRNCRPPSSGRYPTTLGDTAEAGVVRRSLPTALSLSLCGRPIHAAAARVAAAVSNERSTTQ